MTVPHELIRGSSTASRPVPTQRRPAGSSAWPRSLTPQQLHPLGLRTPFLALDTAMLRRHVTDFLDAFEGRVAVRYAVKCNSEPAVLAAVVEAGGSFEIASAPELDLALAAGAAVEDVFYSNPVKPQAHIRQTAVAGVRRFVVDGLEEIDKIAEVATGVGVLVRIRVDDTSSAFPLSSKFGVALSDAEDLLHYATARGLVAAGLTFHVGSQCTDLHAWSRAVNAVAPLFSRFAEAGTPLQVLDIGGGFPAHYDETVPTTGAVAAVVLASLDAMAHPPAEIVAEPGRALVAETGVIGAEVIGREMRDGRPWIYLEVGAYNGLMEAAQTGARWPYPVLAVDAATGEPLDDAARVLMTVTGPTCDSTDTVLADALLPADLAVGDLLYLGGTGAYTTSYASHFNGFPPPTPVIVA
ncbi:MAG: ornithine decarboxylase [Frankiaceae bacterium]|nr:ornithine decarboxylase [Frankiaceae bacterium]